MHAAPPPVGDTKINQGQEQAPIPGSLPVTPPVPQSQGVGPSQSLSSPEGPKAESWAPLALAKADVSRKSDRPAVQSLFQGQQCCALKLTAPVTLDYTLYSCSQP